MKSLFNEIYKTPKNKDELINLYKKPKKDSYKNTPHIQVLLPNVVQQADLLFLPNDNGYRYALVVVDAGSRLVDAEPIKNKDSESVLKAFKKIYERKILKIPERLEVDPGQEFRGKVADYFDSKKVLIRYGKPGRHRMQALAETANYIIGTILHMRMTGQELLTGDKSVEWIEDLPRIVAAINKRRKKYKPKVISDKPVCEGDSCKLLSKGTKVRVMLDQPMDLLTRKKLPGKFRSGDIRWDPEIRTIVDIIIKPGYPPLYLLNSKKKGEEYESVAYTKNQLQVVDDDEKPPSKELIRGKPEKFIVSKILKKKKKNNKTHYLVKWKTGDETWEPKSNLMKYVPDLIKDFDKK
jgi:hypothetical protein